MQQRFFKKPFMGSELERKILEQEVAEKTER